VPIANAVADALAGVSGLAPDPPFTSEKLWRALRGQAAQ